MKALILAAGLGTRLRPLTDDIPKPMVPIGGKPLLEYHIEHLVRYGIKEICINLHYLPEKITDYFGDGGRWGAKIFYKFEPTMLGTAGAIKNFEDILDDDFLLIYGDMLHQLALDKLVAAHRTKKGIGTVAINQKGILETSDVVEVDAEHRILKIIPKPHDLDSLTPFLWLMQAVYVFSRGIHAMIPANRYCELDHEVLPSLLAGGKAVYGYPTDEPILDIGTWENYKKAEEYLAKLQ